MQQRSAFTLLEVLVTVFIFILVFGFSLLYTQLGYLRADLKTQASIVESYLREAQSNATSGKSGSSFGVHFEETTYTIFSGASYDALESSNFVVTLPDILTFEALALNGAGSDVIFDSPLGTTEEYGTLSLTSSRTGQSMLFTISPLGQVSYE